MTRPTDRYAMAALVGAIIFAFSIVGTIRANDISADEKPNIIFILADDLGFNQIGPYGDTPIKTPNLDRLAQREKGKNEKRGRGFYQGCKNPDDGCHSLSHGETNTL